MYAGLTFTNFSGAILGSHQKIDRIARRALSQFLIDEKAFPPKKLLLHYEGKRGPDGLKSQSPGQEEPWHYYDPFDPEDGTLLNLIEQHYKKLVIALKKHNKNRAAFEASWLSHAILDGFTPSHHYPLEAELEKLRGEPKETRNTKLRKVIIPGNNNWDRIIKNWQAWGFKGLFTTHFAFEWGAATVIAVLPKHIARPNKYEIKTIHHVGLIEFYKRTAREIANLDIYEEFYRRGWSVRLAKIVKTELAPRMAVMTTLAWYLAAHEAGIASGEV